MTVLLNSFEGGTSGTAITTGNSGGASGNAFDTVTAGSGATVAYDGTRAAHGTLSCKIATGASGVDAHVEWNTSFSFAATTWFRMYLYFTGNPVSQHRVLELASGASAVGGMLVSTAGKLLMVDGGGAIRLTSASTIPLNQWFRAEGFITGSAGAGQLSFSLYVPQDSTIAAETQTSAATLSTTGVPTNARFGPGVFNIANVGPYWMDDIGLSSTGRLGPDVARRTSSIVPSLVAAGVLS